MLLMHEHEGVDEYGLPLGVLGAHRNEFFSAIGRVVCVCAVLEAKVTTLRHTLERTGQGSFTNQPVSQQIIRVRDLSRRLPEPGPDRIGAFCDAPRPHSTAAMNLCTVLSRPNQMDGSGGTGRSGIRALPMAARKPWKPRSRSYVPSSASSPTWSATPTRFTRSLVLH